MIICVSANPAIDRRLRVKNLKIGAVNRVLSVESFAGGKAAHVAFAAHALGEKVIWIGFLGGANGAEIERQLTDYGIEIIAVQTASPTRTNDEIIDENGQITEILQPGGAVSETEIEKMFDSCKKVFEQYESNFTAVFSGSLPPNVPTDFYKHLILSARENGGQTILDTSGEAFLKGLEAAPDLIKPNSAEVENALNLRIGSVGDAAAAAGKLIDSGVKNAVISLGKDGLLWMGADRSSIRVRPPRVEVISTVGCGDSTVAGLAFAEKRGYAVPEKLRLAAACGTANCLADLPGQISRENIEKLLPLISVESVDENNKNK